MAGSGRLLDVDGLSLDIHGAPILRDVSLRLDAGRVMGLVGESGSGKSLTALALMGLLPRGARAWGAARMGGRDLLSLRERDWLRVRGAEIGMIFQEPMSALNPVQNVGAQVAEGPRLAGMGRAEARALARERLDRVGLGEVGLERYPHELSGGQRQRACIAMALARRPRLLIADEPTTALDVTTQARILALLRGLVDEEGLALLLITHDLGVVAGMADRIAVMREGRVVEEGRTEALLRARRHPYTRALVAAALPPPRAPASRPPGPPVVALEDVTVRYGGHAAVDGASLEVRPGEAVGLVGESGSGKSTLARALVGLEPLARGRIRRDGEAGFVFQDPYGSFDPRWRVERIVAEPFHRVGRPADWRARVAAALDAVALPPDAATRYPHEFSGGQRQRIAVARALVTEPRLVILDEATSALDVSVRAQVLALLRELQARRGLAYLFVAHDLAVVRALCTHVAVMRGGRIVEAGPAAEVMARPAHPYTRALVEAAPTIPEAWLREGAGAALAPRGAAG